MLACVLSVTDPVRTVVNTAVISVPLPLDISDSETNTSSVRLVQIASAEPTL